MRKRNSRKLVGHVGVDSGQVMICDPCYIDSHWEKVTWETHEEFLRLMEDNQNYFNYLGACHASLKSENMASQFDLGVCSSSGWGDGEYPVYATYQNGRVKKLEVVFF